MPFEGGWTVLGRMRQGKPIVVHGDGTSLWTLTHHRDFALGFVPLLGHPRADSRVDAVMDKLIEIYRRPAGLS
ncbi:MAG: hypothetical protein ACM3ML_03075 [Micromonosporaceae bacterium]